ncbi:MAG: hypothetical protein P8X42_18950 [Calditrichaceae bacterium]
MKLYSLWIVFLVFVKLILAQEERNEDWWESYQFIMPYKSETAKKLPLISVRGNKFVNSDGDTILFRGLAVSDPDKLADQGHWNKQHFEKIKEMGASLVRIPIHPAAWRQRSPKEYLKLLEQAVEW